MYGERCEDKKEHGREKDCEFCGHDFMKDHKGGEWKRCKEEERCFEKTFECRERRIIECREKDRKC